MKLTNEQIKAILDVAPDGATHYTSTAYLRYDSRSWVWWSEVANDWCFVRDESLGWAQHLSGYHGSLSDLREILELRQEVGRLKAQQSEVAARAVEDAVMNTPTHRMKVDERLYHSQKALLDYANQLREQGYE